MKDNEQVRYHMLRPSQIVKRRKAFPVAYIPVGTLEWHGEHNAVGADTLQAEGMAIRCAQKGGGLVFPPLYYGENRLEALMEANANDKEQIAEKMDLPCENFSKERMMFGQTDQMLLYNRLLLQILDQAASLGFAIGVLVAGHYPLIDHCRAAVLQYNQRRYGENAYGMLAWAFCDYLLIDDQYECAGDHAGGWETSHMMALHPETVDKKTLPERGKKPIGAGGKMDPLDSSDAFGLETIEKATDIAVNEVQHRLRNPMLYAKHGCWLKEGLWRKTNE